MTSAGPLLEYATGPIPDGPGLAATITLNRPQELNAISWDMVGAFDEAVTRVAAEPDVRILFITGSGARLQRWRRSQELPVAAARPGQIPAIRQGSA